MSLERKVTRAIIGASYNDSGPNVDEIVRRTAEKEKKAGNRFINHLILRSKVKARDRLKHHFLLPPFTEDIPGVPVLSYVLKNIEKSSIEEASVVGNEDTEKIVDKYNGCYDVPEGRFRYADEGEKWGMSNTIEKGRNALSKKEGMLFFLPGDTPLFISIDEKIKDVDVSFIDEKDGRMYDVILDLNGKRKVGKFWPRNFHWKVIYKGRRYDVKEGNGLLFDPDKTPPKLIDSVYGGRKTYMEDGSGGGRGKTLRDLFIWNGKWKGTLEALEWEDIPLIKAIPALKKYLEQGSTGSKWFARLVLGPPSGLINLLTDGIVSVRTKTFERAVDYTNHVKIKVKVENDDPGTLEDIDSLEDWAYMTQMLNENGSAIYPYFDEMKKFRDEAMPKLMEEVPMYKDWHGYMNELFETYGLNLPYVNGEFRNPFSSKAVNRMIKKNLKFHRKYISKLKRKKEKIRV